MRCWRRAEHADEVGQSVFTHAEEMPRERLERERAGHDDQESAEERPEQDHAERGGRGLPEEGLLKGGLPEPEHAEHCDPGHARERLSTSLPSATVEGSLKRALCESTESAMIESLLKSALSNSPPSVVVESLLKSASGKSMPGATSTTAAERLEQNRAERSVWEPAEHGVQRLVERRLKLLEHEHTR